MDARGVGKERHTVVLKDCKSARLKIKSVLSVIAVY